MLVNITIQGLDDWALELELEPETTVGKFKELLAAAPHSVEITSKTKVLWRRANHCLMALLDNEKVKATIVMLNAAPTVIHMAFPTGFVWGSATAAYQIEGATTQGGRTPSIWDTFAKVPGNIDNGDTADMACDHYFRFREDVRLMKDLGLPAYRFSISWSRLLPEGRGEVNEEAVVFYRSLLEELAAHEIQPLVTLYHWDLPQCLEDEYGGWRSRLILEDFEDYASTCFSSFGDLVKSWITINEPWCAAVLGYASGEHAPGRKEAPLAEPYLVAHHMILAHARAVRRYRMEFKPKQQGRIGITLNMDWKEPLSSSESDLAAQRRALAWQLGWFADPIYRGHYPAAMRSRCKDRLPSFTEAEQRLVKGSSDFFGLNHYSTDYVSADLKQDPSNFFEDSEVRNISDPNWSKTGMGWDIVPWGLRRLVSCIHREYAPPGGIVITENGCAAHEESAKAAKNDGMRVAYMQGYLTQLHKAIKEGANVWGYFAWSLFDNFEWAFGYAKRFGLVRVEYATQERKPKASARVLSEVARENALRAPAAVVADSEFAPMGERRERAPAPQRPATKAAAGAREAADVVLTLRQALDLLSELADHYQEPGFQHAMEAAYRKFEQHGSNLSLSKARQAICLPIQSLVLPKYGFQPNAAGVHGSVMALRAPDLVKEAAVARLTLYNNFLISDLPQMRVRADARRREREEQREVMEALGLAGGEAPPSEPPAEVPEAAAPGDDRPLEPEEAKRVLEEFSAQLQDFQVQDNLIAAWMHSSAGGNPAVVADVIQPLWAKAWAVCNKVPSKSWDVEGWMPPKDLQSQDLARQEAITSFLWQELPRRRAKEEAKKTFGPR